MNVFLLLCAAAGFLGVLELVRRRRLREEFSWLWSVGFLALMILALSPSLRLRLQGWMPLGNEGSVVHGISLFFLAALAMDFSLRISRLATQHKNLAQELALLRQRLDERSEEKESRGPRPAK